MYEDGLVLPSVTYKRHRYSICHTNECQGIIYHFTIKQKLHRVVKDAEHYKAIVCQRKTKSNNNLSVQRDLKKRNDPTHCFTLMGRNIFSFMAVCDQCVVYDLCQINRTIESQNKIEDSSTGKRNCINLFPRDLFGDENGELPKISQIKITYSATSCFFVEIKDIYVGFDFEMELRTGKLADDKDTSIILHQKNTHGFVVWLNQSRRPILDFYRCINFGQKSTLRKSELVTNTKNVKDLSSIIIQSVYRGFRARRHLKNICSKNFSYVDSDLEGIFSDEVDCLLNVMLDGDANLESVSTMHKFPDDHKLDEKIFRFSDDADFSVNTTLKQNISGETINIIPDKRLESQIKDKDQDLSVGGLKKDTNKLTDQKDSIMKEWNLNTTKVAEVSVPMFCFITDKSIDICLLTYQFIVICCYYQDFVKKKAEDKSKEKAEQKNKVVKLSYYVVKHFHKVSIKSYNE